MATRHRRKQQVQEYTCQHERGICITIPLSAKEMHSSGTASALPNSGGFILHFLLNIHVLPGKLDQNLCLSTSQGIDHSRNVAVTGVARYPTFPYLHRSCLASILPMPITVPENTKPMLLPVFSVNQLCSARIFVSADHYHPYGPRVLVKHL